jgi:hypothetical protein
LLPAQPIVKIVEMMKKPAAKQINNLLAKLPFMNLILPFNPFYFDHELFIGKIDGIFNGFDNSESSMMPNPTSAG